MLKGKTVVTIPGCPANPYNFLGTVLQYATFGTLPELDDKSNPLKSKGIGELGICGAGAAVANAIYNACGVRVRSYPITLDKLILDPAFPAPD